MKSIIYSLLVGFAFLVIMSGESLAASASADVDLISKAKLDFMGPTTFSLDQTVVYDVNPEMIEWYKRENSHKREFAQKHGLQLDPSETKEFQLLLHWEVTLSFFISGDKYRYHAKTFSLGKKTVENEQWAWFDGRTKKIYDPLSKLGNVMLNDGITLPNLIENPRALPYRLYDKYLWEWPATNSTISVRQYSKNGMQLLEHSIRTPTAPDADILIKTIWDPRTLTLLGSECLGKKKNKGQDVLSVTLESRDFLNHFSLSTGMHYPQKAIVTRYVAEQPTNRNSDKMLLRDTTTVVSSNIKADLMDQKNVFDAVFPIGTRVHNAITDISYVQGDKTLTGKNAAEAKVKNRSIPSPPSIAQ